jgi:hypothetical protein
MNMSMDYGGAVDRQIINQSVRGRDKLIQASHGILQGWARENLLLPSQQCSSISICSHKKLLVAQLLFPTIDGHLHQLGPWDQESKTPLCKPCFDSLNVAYEKARQKLWDDLPSFFGLPPWEELKDFDA